MQTENAELRSIAWKAVKFLTLLVVLDFVLGSLAQKAFESQTTGKFARIARTLDSAAADVWILGSSHANRHYVPSIIEAELDASCYNAGVQGQLLPFQEVISRIILARTQPKLIVLNIDDRWLFHSPESRGRLSDLHPFYWNHRNEIRRAIGGQWFTDIQMLSKAYRYNSTVAHVLKYYLSPQPDYDGYRPLFGEMMPGQHRKARRYLRSEISAAATESFRALLRDARDRSVRIVCMVSPTCNAYSESESMQLMKAIAQEEGVQVFDFANDERFAGNNSLFFNESHLNDEGAKEFSGVIAPILKDVLGVSQKHGQFSKVE